MTYWRICDGALVGADDSPDLLGETMVVAWRRVADLPDAPERARMWLFGIARHGILNHARGERRRWALADRVRTHASMNTSAPAADSGVEVRDAITRLDPDLAEIVRLVHWERLSLADAADVVGIPASPARGRYQQAREQLRTALRIRSVVTGPTMAESVHPAALTLPPTITVLIDMKLLLAATAAFESPSPSTR